jgi:hypothetical protein
VIVSSSSFDLCDHLSEERVERDSALYELLNEDVGFFLSLNLSIKSCVPLHLPALLLHYILFVEPIL